MRYKAEELFAEQYCKKMRANFKFVLNMPLRIKEGQRPKYRMIHATNHEDGCILMADNICNRWQLLNNLQNFGQLSLFDDKIGDTSISDSEIEIKLNKHIEKYINGEALNTILADFFNDHGVICKSSKLRNILKKFEKDDKIIVVRKLTETTHLHQDYHCTNL